MEISTFPIPSLHGGISEQPEKIRKVFQCSDSLNSLPTLDSGFRLKRQPSLHLGAVNISGILFADLFKTSTDEYFWFVVTTGGIPQVYTLAGTPVTTTPANASVLSYLASGIFTYDTTRLYKLMSVLDYTFVLNKSVVANLTLEPLFNTSYYGVGLIYMPQVVASIDYTVSLSVNSSSGAQLETTNLSSNTAALSLAAVMAAITGGTKMAHVEFSSSGSVATFKVRRATIVEGGVDYYCKVDHTASAATQPGVGASWTTYWTVIGATAGNTIAWASGTAYYGDTTARTFDIVVTTSDSYGNTLLKNYSSYQYVFNAKTFHVTTTDSYQDLPPNGPGDLTVFKVTDHYYVKFDSSKGVYIECVAPGYGSVIDSKTMPMKMVYNPAVPSFTISQVDDYDTAGRLVGDLQSAPDPNFIGNTINDIAFFRNRFFITASDSFNMSRAKGYYFSFYPQTATEELDDDPIFGIPDSNDLNILGFCTPVKNNMLVTAPKRSFFIHSGADPMTPKTATGDPITDFVIRGVPPVVLGSSVMFLEDRGEFTGVLDFIATKDSVSSEASKATAHVPKLIPSGVSKMIPIPSSDLLLVLTKGTNDIYVYKYFVDESNQLQQSAWTKWTLRGEIMSAGLIGGTTVAFLCKDPVISNRVFIESIDTGNSNPDSTNRFTYCLDRGRNMVVSGGVITSPSLVLDIVYSALIVVDKTTGKVVSDPEAEDGTYFCGYPYESFINLTPPYPKDETGSPRYDIETSVMDLRVDFYGGIFQLEVKPMNRSARTYESLQYMQQGLNLDEVDLVHSNANNNPTKFLVFGKNEGLSLKIKSSYHTPLDIHGLAYKLGITQLENS